MPDPVRSPPFSARRSVRLHSIGALARQSGVPVKTIRFYSDEGLLPPSDVSAAGYRRYSDEDRARLETIRALRRLDLDLEQIRALLEGRRSIQQTLQLRAEALDVQLRQLKRTRAVLERVTRDDEDDPLAALGRLEALDKLDALERERFLARSLDRAFAGVPVDEAWRERFYAAAFDGLPEVLDDEQWAALVELVELLSDEGFTSGLAAAARPFWEDVQRAGGFEEARWRERTDGIVQAALRLLDEGAGPGDPRARSLAEEMLEAWAEARGRASDGAFAVEVAERGRSHDPRAERFWVLVAALRKRPPSRVGEAWRFVLAAVELVANRRGHR